jgi:hypothetical protein
VPAAHVAGLHRQAYLVGMSDSRARCDTGNGDPLSVEVGNFRSWFVEVLTGLYEQPNAGFAILMIAFPILERYLRQKVRIASGVDLDDRAYDELARLFPELRDKDSARRVWHVFRHGILHQTTFSSRTKRGKALPAGVLSHEVARLEIDANGTLLVNAVDFSKRVIEIVEADFATYVGAGGGSALPLPTVSYIPARGPTGYVLGTAAPVEPGAAVAVGSLACSVS